MSSNRRTAIAGALRATAITAILGFAIAVLVVFEPPDSANALDGSDFQPGYMISDSRFYDSNAMSESEIQSFLDAKIGSCSNSNCLNIKKTTTFDRAADRNVCSEYDGAANESTARIIYKVQQACGISAKVLLVTLQEEQSLVTSKSPSTGSLRIAMGYGCPDTAPCDSEFFGLYNQLYKAAWQLKRYSTPDPWGNYQPGTRSIQYHPDPSCGSKTVVIQNDATAALYNYTPYVPNAAALANLGGTGNSCSSYGNRNFWMFYNNWFGNPLTSIPQGVEVERIGGGDRFDVSAGVTLSGFAPTVPVLYIADGLNFPDALSAGAAAAKQDGALLIVTPTRIPEAVMDEILRLAPQRIVVAGGPSSVTAEVFDELAGLAPEITRIGGADRYQVSRDLALSVFGAEGTDVVYLADGRKFPDALSAGAAAASRGAPVILVNGSKPSLDVETMALLDELGSSRVIITGGPASVSPGIEQTLAESFAEVDRMTGSDRYVVSGAVNREAFESSDSVYVALGTKFPDALSGVPLAALGHSPLYLVRGNCIPHFVVDDIISLGSTTMTILGGEGSLTPAVQDFNQC